MSSLKSKIIPNKIKENIDEILEKQLLNANRYFAETNANISELMNIEKVKKPSVFLERLKERWDWHNLFYEELLEPAYEEIIKESSKELSSKELDDILKIYKTLCLVDEATLVMSGAIKKNLEYNLNTIPIDNEDFDAETSRIMLITPPKETFFAEYQMDHLYYIYLLKTNDSSAENYKEYLKDKYHAGDEIIFNSRFNKKFKSMLNYDEKDLLKSIEQLKFDDSYKTKHFYLTFGHSERKAISDLIVYDNLDEKLIACKLIGISGFLFRKKVLEYLNDEKLLLNEGNIYEFSNDMVEEKLEDLKMVREKAMEKNVKPYRQTGLTCAIVCMLMTLEYNKLIDNITEEEERRLYGKFHSKYLDGTPFSALAMYLSEKGLETELIHNDINMFNNEKKFISNYIFDLSVEEYKEYLNKAKENGTKVLNGVNINHDILKKKLDDGNLLIIAGKHGYDLHAILICGYEDDNFIVCDPLYNEKQKRSFEDIDEFMDAFVGKWFLSVGGQKKNKKDLMNNLDYFNFKANEYLGNDKLKAKKEKVKRLVR